MPGANLVNRDQRPLPRPWVGTREAKVRGEFTSPGPGLQALYLSPQSLALFCNMGIFSHFEYSYPILQMRDWKSRDGKCHLISHSWD